MGYTLKIGELKTGVEYDGLYSYLSNEVEGVKLENAPAFGEPTDFTNQRWPSYSSWANAMQFVGLESFMFHEEKGLLRNHPGCVPLVKEHKEVLDNAYEMFYKKYPNCKAGYSPKINEKEGIYEDDEWPKENDYATRLEWLKFWIDWALENCKCPVFYNS